MIVNNLSTTPGEAYDLAVELAKQTGAVHYVFVLAGGVIWRVSEQYAKEWIFKAYPGGRTIIKAEERKSFEAQRRKA